MFSSFFAHFLVFSSLYISLFSPQLNPKLYGVQVRPGEPVYAQVNRDRKRSKGGLEGPPDNLDYSDRHWQTQQPPQPAAGDSWV
jgi:hypothetical protein